jgi:2-oxoglutarate ferredoxin oxidoreductase subunit alpha
VLLLTDGILGQIMEPIDIRPLSISGLGKLPSKEWALTGLESRGEQSILSTMLMRENQVLEWHERATDKYRRIQENEIRFDTYYWEEAWIGVVAFGMTARAVETAVDLCRENGIPVGLLRPITLFPFCSDFLHHSLSHIQQFLVVEVNLGQMVEDVRLAVGGERSVDFLGQPAGLPSPSQVVEAIERLARDNG